MRLPIAALLLTTALHAQTATHPRDKEIHDPDTKAWWHTTEALSGDSMEGRDTGSAAYQRAADYVANRLKAAGLKPAGDSGTYFQSVPMHEVEAVQGSTRFALIRKDGSRAEIPFLLDITFVPSVGLPLMLEAPLTFRGYCGKEALLDAKGKVVICFATQRKGLPSGAERIANARAAGAIGVLNVDDPYFTIEPPRWPAAYARSVSLAGPAEKAQSAAPLLSMRMSTQAFSAMLEGTGHDAAAILAAGGKKKSLPSFDLAMELGARIKLSERSYSSPNILAVLPGSDPTLAAEHIVIAAHLDGYGYGTPVAGDNLYNGALDDAAYVALLIQLADDLKRDHKTPKRSILFCAFTGEEKGLLGSSYFVEHPTVPLAQLAADINLDQLRPLFPLHLLTALAIDDTTLGETARQVGGPLGIRFQADPEPERGLLRRADHYPFLKAGIPAIGFIFGYEPGTDAEARYREWYQIRYHRPQDDLTQPMDFQAAHDFNAFFYKLTETLANDPRRPAIAAASPFHKP